MLVLEKAVGQYTRSINLIRSNPDEPEMYELQCQNPRKKRVYIDMIGGAVALRNVFLPEIKARRPEINVQTDLVAYYDLLWKFYEKSGLSTAISLPLRIEYLSRVIVCARAADTSSFGNAVQGQFLYEMEEKMDVAKVQSQIHPGGRF